MQSISYVGDGSTTEFNFNFPYYEDTNIVVTMNNNILTSGYNVVGTSAGLDADIPYIGGKVVFDTAPREVDSITIKRQLPLNRFVDYQPTAKLEPTSLNQDMNYMMEVLKDFSDKLDNFSVQYSEIVDKESTQNLIEKMTNMTEKINEFDEEVEQGYIMSKDCFYSYMTNCITEIPQNIKFELNNGTLTLKSGSKIHIANGTLDNTDITTADISITNSNDGKYLIIRNSATSLYAAKTRSCLSGTIANRPLSLQDNAGLYFATDENKMYLTGNGGSSWFSGSTYSLPLGIVTVSSGGISSIDQIFNGFGYIGSTVFALPGVKGLIPNGRNSDGTLRNTTFTVNSVTNKIVSGTVTDKAVVLKNNDIGPENITYNATTNYNSDPEYCICGKISISSNVITSFDAKTVFNI